MAGRLLAGEEGTAESWQGSVKQIFDDLQALRDLVSDERSDLFAKIPHGDGQTIIARGRCWLQIIMLIT